MDQKDLFALTQLKDGFDYNKTVIGFESNKADVLTGWAAYQFTSMLNGSEGAMTLCLDFPSMSIAAINAAAALPGPVVGGAVGGKNGGIAGATVGAIVGAATSILVNSLIQKDIFWPDARKQRDVLRSRGVMTHEYGHFTMCI